jgi:hypothetical protein
MIPDRILNRIEPGDCWQWLGRVGRDGYGQVWLAGRTRVAHRAIYELLVRDLGREEQLDHLCRNRSCVNPDHLEVVSCRTNILRGFGAPARAARRPPCRFGHAYQQAPRGDRRVCRECGKRWSRQYRQRRTPSSATSGRLSKGVAA